MIVTSIVTYACYTQVVVVVYKRETYLPMTSTTSLSVGAIDMLMLGQETEGIESDLREIHNVSLEVSFYYFHQPQLIGCSSFNFGNLNLCLGVLFCLFHVAANLTQPYSASLYLCISFMLL